MRESTHNFAQGVSARSTGVAAVDVVAEAWVRRLQQGLSVEEEVEFSDWLDKDPRHEVSLRKYQTAWDRFSPLAQHVAAGPVPYPIGAVSTAVSTQHGGPEAGATDPALFRAPVHRWILPAVGIAVAAALVLLVRPLKLGPPADGPVVLPAVCEQRTLPDGSAVELNRGAKIEVQFTDSERRVRLKRGEANFKVAKNPARPFIVAAGAVEVRAVGTVFNVRLDPADVEVVVTEGRVHVENRSSVKTLVTAASLRGGPDSGSCGTYLTAGQREVIASTPAARSSNVTTLTASEIAARLAWQPKLLDFDDTPLSDIVAEFNHRNPVRLIVTDSAISNRRMTATFRSDNLESFVSLLEGNIGIKARRINDTEIELTRK